MPDLLTPRQIPPAPPGPPTSPLQVTDLLLILIITLGSVRLLSPLLADIFSGDGTEMELSPVATLALTLSLVVIQNAILLATIQVLAIRKYGLTWADLGLVPPPGRWIRMGILIGLLCLPLVTTVNGTFQDLFSLEPDKSQMDVLAPAGFSWPAMIAVLAVVGTVVPFIEELAFRGMLFGWLRDRLGLVPAIIISAFCFALLHGIPQLIPAIMALGIVLALVVHLSQSVWAAIIVHASFNIASTLLLYADLATRSTGS